MSKLSYEYLCDKTHHQKDKGGFEEDQYLTKTISNIKKTLNKSKVSIFNTLIKLMRDIKLIKPNKFLNP